MKRYNIFAFLLLLIAGAANAQTTDVSGTIKDEEGQPVHFAFLKDVQSKNAAYTDSLGDFTIKIAPNSSLYINCFGFKDTVVKVDSRANIAIVLKTSVNISANKTNGDNTNQHADAVKQYQGDDMTLDHMHGVDPGQPDKNITIIVGTAGVEADGKVKIISYSERLGSFDAGPGSLHPQFNPKEETQGSRYLLRGWVHGYVISPKDAVIQAPEYMFEYDKLGGALLLTKNGNSAIEVDRDMVRSFTLFDNSNASYVFENMPQINPSHYVQVLATGDRYRIYKDIKTTFSKANYSSDGVMSSGHNYDEYTDEYNYYVYDVKTKTVQKLVLKKKALKEAFAADADKLNKFMGDHSSDSVDEMYLSELGESLNE